MHAGAFWVRTLYSDLIRLLPEATSHPSPYGVRGAAVSVINLGRG